MANRSLINSLASTVKPTASAIGALTIKSPQVTRCRHVQIWIRQSTHERDMHEASQRPLGKSESFLIVEAHCMHQKDCDIQAIILDFRVYRLIARSALTRAHKSTRLRSPEPQCYLCGQPFLPGSLVITKNYRASRHSYRCLDCAIRAMLLPSNFIDL